MKPILILLILNLSFIITTLAYQHKARGKVVIPSILFPDVIPFGNHYILRRYHHEAKNLTTPHQNDTNSLALNLKETNLTFPLTNLSANLTDNIINLTTHIKNNELHNNKPFHFLECLTYLKKESLTPQLIVCLGMFALVLIIMISVQCLFQGREKRQMEFQRAFKMAINEKC